LIAEGDFFYAKAVQSEDETFLADPAELRGLLSASGFRELFWQDRIAVRQPNIQLDAQCHQTQP